MENNLPKGWEEISLENIAAYVIGGDWGKDEPEPGYEKVFVLRGTDYKNWNNERARNSAIRYCKEQSVEKRQLVEGDMVLEVSGGGPDQPVGRVIYIDKKALDSVNGKLSFSNFFRLIRIDRNLNPFFIKSYLDLAYSRGDFNDMQTHTTNLRNLRVNEFLSQTLVPIPPLQEQQRIVAKLDELMEKIDRSRARLERIPKILKRFRQSVLAAAVSGKLTEEWRSKNIVVKDAEVFLLDIQNQRQDKYQTALDLYKQKKGKKPRDAQDALEPEYRIDDSYPDTWRITRIKDISECLDYIRKPINKDERSKRLGSVPYYGANGQVGWIDDHLFDEDLVVVVEDETFIGREIPFSYVIRGKTWVNNHAHVLRPLGGMTVEYLNACLSFYNFIPLTSGTTGRRKLNQGALMEAELAIAPLEEQREIVKKIDALFKIAEKLELRYKKAKAQLDKLPQSLLAKAFRGELVVQNENDEPATALLQKIRAVKTGVSNKKGKMKEYSLESLSGFEIAAEPNGSYKLVHPINIPENKKAFAKQVLGGKIVSLFKDDPNFTHIKFQKLQYLAEHLAEVDLNWNYYRQSAGPYDPKFMHTVALKLKASKWFEERKYKFYPLEKADKIEGYYDGYFKPAAVKLDSLFTSLKNSTEDEAEIVATLYAVWNNMIIKKESINNDVIVSTFFEWSDRKKKYSHAQVIKTLAWMKKNRFVPTGFGKLIKERRK